MWSSPSSAWPRIISHTEAEARAAVAEAEAEQHSGVSPCVNRVY